MNHSIDSIIKTVTTDMTHFFGEVGTFPIFLLIGVAVSVALIGIIPTSNIVTDRYR